jgi:lysophospholipase L1-like esterase
MILGRKDANVVRSELNDRIRKENEGIAPVFDLAAIESTSPAGEPVTFTYQGKKYPCLYRGYTTDGGHLNEAGKRTAAAGLLQLLVRIVR